MDGDPYEELAWALEGVLGQPVLIGGDGKQWVWACKSHVNVTFGGTKMRHRNFDRVIYTRLNDGTAVKEEEPRNPQSFNFRIVSAFGQLDWSPFGSLAEMEERFKTLPAREDGYFLIVEG